jgi:hypothetical protein
MGARVVVLGLTAFTRPLAVCLAGAMRRAVASDVNSPVLYIGIVHLMAAM